MLLTLVDPHPGFEQAYNRWYERDHFYAGCMVGPYLFAGSRWVSPRPLKDLRWPIDVVEGAVADPYDRGSYVAIYWVEQGHHDDHFDWARTQVRYLYANNRGFPERRHAHTVLFDHLGCAYRDADPVPVDLALDAGYDGVVIAWFDAIDGDADSLRQRLEADHLPVLLEGSDIESASSWTPSAGENEPRNEPMDLGSAAGGPERLCQLFFIRGDVTASLDRLHAYTDSIADIAHTRLAAPFVRTVVGTDRYVDELW
jgi:hypothetical protein